MPALYTVYRPRRFSEVVGQSHIVRTLRNAVVNGKPAHAYLFSGSRGLGKTTLARVLSCALNCENLSSEAEACLSCSSCLAGMAGNFLDTLEVDAASNTGVDNVRALIETVYFQPTSGKYKMYIIDEAHMLSKGAWNALLKTLEEPPQNTVFVLATTESAKVPATIYSRAQAFTFHSFSTPEIIKQLEHVLTQEHSKLAAGVVELVASKAGGGMRDALTALDQVLTMGGHATLAEVETLLGVTSRAEIAHLLGIIHQGEAASLPTFFSKLGEVYFDFLGVNRDILECLRELLESKLSGGTAPVGLAGVCGYFTSAELVYLIRQFLWSYKEAHTSPDPSLPLLITSLESCSKLGVKDINASQKNQQPVQSLEVKPVVGRTPEVVEFGKSASGHASLSEAELREKWPFVCEGIRKINGPLATLIKNAPVLSMDKGVVKLSVKYLFHKEQLENLKNRQLFADVSVSLAGLPVSVVGVVAEPKESLTDKATLTDALRIFGGELVE